MIKTFYNCLRKIFALPVISGKRCFNIVRTIMTTDKYTPQKSKCLNFRQPFNSRSSRCMQSLYFYLWLLRHKLSCLGRNVSLNFKVSVCWSKTMPYFGLINYFPHMIYGLPVKQFITLIGLNFASQKWI